MLSVKAKDKYDWNVWHYGILEAPDKIRRMRSIISILLAKGQMNKNFKCTCNFMFMGPAKHEEVAIFLRKMSGFRMFEAISERFFA